MMKVWERFEVWLKENYKAAFLDLKDPASSEEIGILEATISMDLPQEFRNFLCIHNGQTGQEGGIIDGSKLLSTEGIANEWEILKYNLENSDIEEYLVERNNGVKSDCFLNTKWIPFTSDGCGNFYCLDLDPAAKGSFGQVITLWHDDPEREVLAVSFKEWFAKYVTDLEDGKYVYYKEYPSIVNADVIES